MKNEVHIPTVTGTNVIGFSLRDLNKVYRARLEQTGVNAPIPTVIENTFGGDFVFGYAFTGFYTATLVGAFSSGQLFAPPQIGSATFPLGVALLQPFSGGADQFFMQGSQLLSEGDGNPISENYVDDILVNHYLEVENIADTSTLENLFLAILTKLDSIQLSIWDKIILRNSGTVTEVDGDKYRRTGDFNASIKTINS